MPEAAMTEASGGAERPEAAMTERSRSAEQLKLVLSWLFVGIPAVWGVAQVVMKSAALFK
jgi:hypothetical protein